MFAALGRILPRVVPGLAIALALILEAAGVYHIGITTALEAWLYDARLRLTLPDTRDHRIVIVDIDEQTLLRAGRWPWPRDRLATLVDTLFDHYGISVAGFDMVFAEGDQSSDLTLMDALAAGKLANDQEFLTLLDEIRPAMQRDQRFAESLSGRPVILGFYFQHTDDRITTGALPPPIGSIPQDAGKPPFIEARGYVGSLAELQRNALSGGYFDNPSVDADGVYRRVALIQSYRGHLYEGLALAVTRALLGSTPVQLEVANTTVGTALEAINIGVRIPVDEHGRALVPYRGRQGSFPYVSAADVMERRIDPQVLAGAIVLVGTSAPGLSDLRATPVQNVFPGVEVHANLISGFLDQRVKYYPDYRLGVEGVQLLAIALILALILPGLSPVPSLAIFAAVLSAVTATNLYLWHTHHLVVPLASSVVLAGLLFILHVSSGFVRERHLKRQLAKRFGQYVPAELVARMSANPGDYGFGGESREMTVLFSDVRDFTSISESMAPQELVQLMNELLTTLTHIVHKHGGTIDKYMGDAIMAFWGAPLADPKHSRHALDAAMEMIEAIPNLQQQFSRRGWPAVRIGVGLNTGIMSVGNMGSVFRMAYTVLGDSVNLGSRLEGLTKQYGVSIVVSEFLRNQTPDYVFRTLGKVRVKGKQEPVTVFEPIGPRVSVDQETLNALERHDQALRLYHDQDWDAARPALQALQYSARESRVYALYLEMIDHYQRNPPGPDWDGVEFMATK